MNNTRKDFPLIASFIPKDSKILDVGCGNGELLSYLKAEKNTDTRGIELSMDGVRNSVKAKHSVVQGNADNDLKFYPSKSFDVAILSKTIQATTAPDEVLKQITRIGKKAVIGFSNFGHYNVLWDLVTNKRMPVTKALPLSWYKTPNIHFCTIRDFTDLCDDLNLKIESYTIISKSGKTISANPRSYRAGWFGAEAIFLISDKS